MLSKIVSNFLAGMNTSAIPNQDDVARKMLLKMFKRFNGLLAMNCIFKMSFVDFARKRKATAVEKRDVRM